MPLPEIATTVGHRFRIESCYACGVQFGIPAALNDTHRRDKQTFYCPNGHGQVYADTLADTVRRLQKDLGEALTARDRAEREKAAAEAAKAALLARVHKGVCPHCRRSFTNLRRHVATKHPTRAT
jgi:hypothetical protein